MYIPFRKKNDSKLLSFLKLLPHLQSPLEDVLSPTPEGILSCLCCRRVCIHSCLPAQAFCLQGRLVEPEVTAPPGPVSECHGRSGCSLRTWLLGVPRAGFGPFCPYWSPGRRLPEVERALVTDRRLWVAPLALGWEPGPARPPGSTSWNAEPLSSLPGDGGGPGGQRGSGRAWRLLCSQRPSGGTD